MCNDITMHGLINYYDNLLERGSQTGFVWTRFEEFLYLHIIGFAI